MRIVKYVTAVYDAFQTFWLGLSTSPATSLKRSLTEDSSTRRSLTVLNWGALVSAPKIREALEGIIAKKGIMATAELLRKQFSLKELQEIKKTLGKEIYPKIQEMNLRVVLSLSKRKNLDENQKQELAQGRQRLTGPVRKRKDALKAVDLALKLKSQNPPDVEKL